MLKLHYPFKPFKVAQKWGNRNPMYKANGFNFNLHNGIDANVGGKTTFPVYCPSAGFQVHLVRNMPNGGGNEMWLMSKEPIEMFEQKCHAYMVFAHADKILLPVGYEPEVGEMIMVADNTGFSTGPHTHWGLYRVNYDGKNIEWIDKNEANGSFDPALFFTKEFAVDKASLSTLIRSGLRYYKYLITK